jgi:hypothetical protein
MNKKEKNPNATTDCITSLNKYIIELKEEE